MRPWLLALAITCGCADAVTGAHQRSADAAACEDACNVTPRSPPCTADAEDPSLAGAHVHVEGDVCRVPTDHLQRFSFSVQLEQPITYTAPDSGGACGRCGAYTDNPMSLVSYEIAGGSSHYCECDVGCCPPTTSEPHTLQAGLFEDVIMWPGREWDGPSDTGQTLGPPFPPGGYNVVVSFAVPGRGAITARLAIEVFAP